MIETERLLLRGWREADRAPGVEGEIEIGWRLKRDAWGAGYAREAARASLDWGFGTLGAARVIALVATGNARSWGLMERLGMRRRADLDFDWDVVPEGHALRPTLVYEALRP